MRSLAGTGLAVVLAVLLQSTVLPVLGVGAARPDLLVVICVYLGLHVHSPAGAVGAFAIGYVEDSLSGTLLGLNAFAMSVVFTTVYLTSRRLWVDNTLSKIVLVFLASLQKTVIVVLLAGAFLSFEGLWQKVVRYVFLQAAIAALLSPAIFAALSRAFPVPVEE